MFYLLQFSFCWVLEVIATVMTSPYPVIFVFVPRVASNWKEVRFEELLSWKQIMCCHEINSCSQPERHCELNFFWAYASCYYLTFVSSAFFDLSNIRFSKKLIFTDYSVLTDFCYYLHLPLQCLSFWVLLIKELFEDVLQ